MYITRNKLLELRRTLDDAIPKQVDDTPSTYHCTEPNLIDGLNYRLEPKPNARLTRLIEHDYECEKIQGVIHVKIPLGDHGTDHLAIDPETGKIVCLLCHGVE